MKKSLSLKLVIFISLFFTSCQDNTKEMLIGKWIVLEISVFSTENTRPEDSLMIQDVVNKEIANQVSSQEFFFEIKKDGTYEQDILGDKGSGTWELKEDNKSLVNESGDVLSIEEISKEKFIMTRENEEYGFRIEFVPAK